MYRKYAIHKIENFKYYIIYKDNINNNTNIKDLRTIESIKHKINKNN